MAKLWPQEISALCVIKWSNLGQNKIIYTDYDDPCYLLHMYQMAFQCFKMAINMFQNDRDGGHINNLICTP